MISHVEVVPDKDELRSFSLQELEELSRNIRARILHVLSINGGHLSSNLGIVELTIALHRIFDSPQDKFIFDVSHQIYVHKLLTGRDHRFEEIRKYGGLCGFSHPRESAHDHFFAGHAGTALSLALGVAASRDLCGGTEHVLPILGDASLTCGLTLEALNNIPKTRGRFIIVLNDNAMSISQNVGNIKDLENPALFFEQFGLSYVGPVDGHDFSSLLPALESVKHSSRPILLHILTVKGKGMPAAIANPTSYHGVRPFDPCSGKIHPSPQQRPTFPKIFGRHLLSMAEKNPDLVCVNPATLSGSCLDEFMTRYKERCFDVGIAEGHALTFAGGLAYQKKARVIVSIYATFLQRALDNLFQDICMQELPVIIALDRAFISGPDGSTHHGIYDLSFLNAMPKLVIAQPRNGHLLKELLESSLIWDCTTVIRYPNLETEELPLPLSYRPIGKAELLVQGKELLLLPLGHMAHTALQVREKLLALGLEATVVDPVFVKPLDSDLFESLLLTHRFVVTIEEHALNGGFGMIFNHFLAGKRIQGIKTLNFGIPDLWVQFGSNGELMQELELTPDAIAKKIVDEFHTEKC
ncbi:MAG: 1-deoxy-D-xylulose-5-phosphate synthase [Verrucomicrobiota bacterium]|nr:1-deoxy-D-xylulose-5-phosphate synthase [Verrucomicrobiota bacterium]